MKFAPYYVWTIINHNSAKKKKKFENVVLFQNGGQITDFYFRVISILAKIWKTTFPKEFFNEIWLKVGEYEYIYITEITFKKNYSVLKWRPKQFLILCNNVMLIYAN